MKMKMKMTKLLLLLLPFLLFSITTISTAALPQSAPKSLTIPFIQEVGNCSYEVNITTSCLSPFNTSAEIGILFGDSHGNQIYEPKLEAKSSSTFGKCSEDSFELKGPCTDQICFLYLYRNGSDNWIADTVEISSSDIKTVEFKYNSSIPTNTWYGFDECRYDVPPPPPPPSPLPPSAAARLSNRRWFVSVILVLLIGAFLGFGI